MDTASHCSSSSDTSIPKSSRSGSLRAVSPSEHHSTLDAPPADVFVPQSARSSSRRTISPARRRSIPITSIEKSSTPNTPSQAGRTPQPRRSRHPLSACTPASKNDDDVPETRDILLAKLSWIASEVSGDKTVSPVVLSSLHDHVNSLISEVHILKNSPKSRGTTPQLGSQQIPHQSVPSDLSATPVEGSGRRGSRKGGRASASTEERLNSSTLPTTPERESPLPRYRVTSKASEFWPTKPSPDGANDEHEDGEGRPNDHSVNVAGPGKHAYVEDDVDTSGRSEADSRLSPSRSDYCRVLDYSEAHTKPTHNQLNRLREAAVLQSQNSSPSRQTRFTAVNGIDHSVPFSVAQSDLITMPAPVTATKNLDGQTYSTPRKPKDASPSKTNPSFSAPPNGLLTETVTRGQPAHQSLPRPSSKDDSESDTSMYPPFSAPPTNLVTMTKRMSNTPRQPHKDLLIGKNKQTSEAKLALEADTLRTQLTKSVARLQKRYDELLQINTISRQYKMNAEKQISQLQQRSSSLEDRVRTLEDTVQQLQRQMHELGSEFGANRAQIDSLGIEFKALQVSALKYIPKDDDKELRDSVNEWKRQWHGARTTAQTASKRCGVEEGDENLVYQGSYVAETKEKRTPDGRRRIVLKPR